MKNVFLFCFFFLVTIPFVIGQNVSNKRTVYSLNKDKKTIEVSKKYLEQVSFSFQEKATSFKIKVPGFPSNNNEGNAFDKESIRLLKKAKKGDFIVIFDIKDGQNILVSGPVHIKVI